MATKKGLMGFLQLNGSWMQFVGTVCFAVLILYLNSKYVTLTKYEADKQKTEQRIELFVADNANAHKAIGETLAKISTTLEVMKRQDEQISDLETRMRIVEKVVTIIGADLKKKE